MSAAFVLIIGVLINASIGTQLLSGFERLRGVDDPYLVQVTRLDRVAENIRLTVQTAMAEADVDRLKDVEVAVRSGHEALTAIQALDGKLEREALLRSAFDGYHAAVSDSAKALIEKQTDGLAQLKQMQARQAVLNDLLKHEMESARQTIDAQYVAAIANVRESIYSTLLTGMTVLVVLALASVVIVRSVWSDLGEEPAELRSAVRRIAAGDLDVTFRSDAGEQSLIHGLEQMTTGLRAMVEEIRVTSDSIATASTQIATASLDLSRRTETTASSLQQTTNSMGELTGAVGRTAESASAANHLATASLRTAAEGGKAVDEVVAVMHHIATSSKRIGDVIGVIDDIAAKTNILALNAAVEAARAGEQGKGFAVVASEVRVLAQRSALAAHEVKDLVGASVDHVEAGSGLVRIAGTTMGQVVQSVQRVGEIIGDITKAATAQSGEIGRINAAVLHLDGLTQQNAAMVEESSAAAEHLREQAVSLAKAVGQFKFAESGLLSHG